MKIKAFESNWHNIDFKELNINLTIFKLADLKFYDKFYEEFFTRYNDFDDLSINWRTNKIEIAKAIEKKLLKNSRVLSYGCGIGFIEKFIVEKRQDLKLDCFDFSDIASKWLKRDSSNIYFTSNHEKLKKYDFIFMVDLLYAMGDVEATNLLKKVKYLLKNDGKIIICNTSSQENENNENIKYSSIKNFIKRIKNLIRPVYYFLLKKKKYSFGGYERDKESYNKIFKKAGLMNDKSYSEANQLVQIFKN